MNKYGNDKYETYAEAHQAWEDDKNCACHINPPCASCMNEPFEEWWHK